MTQQNQIDYKARLRQFMTDTTNIACLKGFKYIQMNILSLEEIYIKVLVEINDTKQNTSTTPESTHFKNKIITKKLSIPEFKHPKDSKTNVQKTPSSVDYLITGYPIYNCPYIYLKSNMPELLPTQNKTTQNLKLPIKLESTEFWHEYEIQPWDVLAEIVGSTFEILNQKSQAETKNPFQLNFPELLSLPIKERMVAIGSMLEFLRKVHLRGYYFSDLVLHDIEQLQELYYSIIKHLV
ncbi:hypothetical protein BB558_001223 [Smittium angustum]|uniref:DUF7886 domain-containing protein n=1 Tax=Smittium angustum TaxID=133377 RepID=A0A2U1JC05_SMIAN|nr:hypothetical protein BB558_001223 [Smittium angustum]